MLKNVVVLKNEKIKNIWAVADLTTLSHVRFDELPDDVKDQKLKSVNQGFYTQFINLDSIEIKRFFILVELTNGEFLDNISLALKDNNAIDAILPYKPIIASEKYNTYIAEYIVDFFKTNTIDDIDDDVDLFTFTQFVFDIEKRIENIHITHSNPKTGIVHKEEQLSLCFISSDLKEVAKVKLRYGK